MRSATLAQLLVPSSLILCLTPAALALPTHLEKPLREVLGFSESDLSDAARSAVAREVDSAGGRELIVAGIVQIGATPSQVAAEIRRTRGLIDRKALKQSGAFSQPPRKQDVAAYRLPESDVEALASCTAGNCKFKVKDARIEQLRGLDWSAADLHAQLNGVVRQAMLDYVTDYLTRGRRALAVYVDKPEPESVAEATGQLMQKAAFVRESMPQVIRYFEDFPKHDLTRGRGVLHWSVQDYGYRPVTTVTHTLVYEPAEVAEGQPEVLIAQKHLYTTHYFLARVELMGLFTEGSDRTYLVYVDRSLFDEKVGGLTRSMLVRSVRNDVARRMNAVREHMAARK